MSIVMLTETASERVKQLMEQDGRNGHALRLRVMGGGCSGLQYQLMFDDKTDELDQQGDSNGVRLLVDPKSAVYVVGATIDYIDDVSGRGFRVDNPTVVNSCGCGQSYS
jgi:iron-sulfur cluster assembly accessory protein